ncbi:mobilization protein MobC [Kineococcus xinjiangensis]|uniref:Mobilization protein MobC n=1 Tax=Kineococcus xinjiangensis TaxID=512762 RepID=A0A2S6ICP1_9ACTN|nr:plasmid mobilization relaxosome protein MobC [Kineococcus xinjiangensis]PPK91930.1 mobilization protein MobC [Kineococcus xinjiangensis]
MSEETKPPSFFRRRRRANVEGGRKFKHEVWASESEEARLVVLATQRGVTIPRLLMEAALSSTSETPTERRDLIIELFALHRLLANIANNTNQMAKQMNAYGLGAAEPLSPEEIRANQDAVRRVAFRIRDVVNMLAPS